MFNSFVELCSNIILESLDDDSKVKIDDLINKLKSIKNNKRMNYLYEQLYNNIQNKIDQLEIVGSNHKIIKTNSVLIQHIINHYDNDLILTKDNYIELRNIYKKEQIEDPSDIKKDKHLPCGLYIYDKNSNRYIFWEPDEPIEKYFINPTISSQSSTDLIGKIFNKCCTVKGDIVGNGELLADHIFKNFKMRTSKSDNSYIDGKYKNIDVDIKHTNRFKGGIHNNSNGSPTNDHSKVLRPNTLYIVFDFRNNNYRWAFIYYKGSEK